MKTEASLQNFGLEEGRHFEMRSVSAPVVKADLYTTLGRRLFELYQRYQIEKSDQREIETIVLVLQTFIAAQRPKPWWKKFLRLN